MALTPEQKAALKREILRALDEARTTIVRRASVGNVAVYRFCDADPELVNALYAEFDNFAATV
jgi:hypothetical protein